MVIDEFSESDIMLAKNEMVRKRNDETTEQAKWSKWKNDQMIKWTNDKVMKG